MRIWRSLYIGGALATALHLSASHADTGGLTADHQAINTVVYRGAPLQVSFQSKKLPAWTLHLQQQSSMVVPLPTQLLPGNRYTVQSLRVSARRALPSTFPQQVFASFSASAYNANDYLDWILLPSEAGMAATIGWRIGDPRRLNLAVEVEHRELGQDKEITSLILGVHYYF